MSVGNLKDEGNKGNNFPFQKNLLLAEGEQILLLTGILSALGGAVGPSTATGPIRTSGAGSIPAGVTAFSVYNAGNANGLINGGTIKKGEQMSWDAKGGSYFTGPIAYDGTGTELVITYTI